jgi:hypothetical protein
MATLLKRPVEKWISGTESHFLGLAERSEEKRNRGTLRIAIGLF